MTSELGKGTWLGDCELLLRIGRGGMATVWVARRRGATPTDERLVAVKAMLSDLADDPEFVRMFHDEVNLVSRIRHPNVVDVYGVGEQDGVMYMVMEWVEGDSLHTLIAEAGKRRPIPPEIAVRIIADAAAGLHAAHELRGDDGRLQGVVHRDISPHNVLIGTNGSVKLVDFGVAKALVRLSEATRVGQLKGKFGYMSPEQATGKGVDRRSDVFSLGIVLFELTTNRRLFRGENDVETLHLVISGQIPRPSKVDARYPKRLEPIVLRALERRPENRYQTAHELERDLLDYLKVERIVVPTSGVASLLKRVTGERIEQRRKAVRSALKSLGNWEGAQAAELLPNDPAFTPTGRERITVTGISAVTTSQLSGLSSAGSTGPSPPAPASVSQWSQVGPTTLASRSWIGYLVGGIGLLMAVLVVLLFGRRSERAALPPPERAPALTASAPAGRGGGATDRADETRGEEAEAEKP